MPLTPAPLKDRILASAIDAFLAAALYVAFIVVSFGAVIFLRDSQGLPSTLAAGIALLSFLGLLVSVFILFVRLPAIKGYSPGKKLLDLRVVNVATGRPLGYTYFLARNIAKSFIAARLPAAGAFQLLSITQNPQSKALHDFAANSVVVKV